VQWFTLSISANFSFQIFLGLEGEVRCSTGSTTRRLTKGDSVCLEPGSEYCINNETSSEASVWALQYKM
jgi:quercetin dioxygenase-like cupin family protein